MMIKFDSDIWINPAYIVWMKWQGEVGKRILLVKMHDGSEFQMFGLAAYELETKVLNWMDRP